MPKPPEVQSDLPMVRPRRVPKRLVGASRPEAPSTEERQLDDALADSFPASDPVSFLQPAPRDKKPSK